MNRHWAVLVPVCAAFLLLGGCYVDADADGIDDNTGDPIPVTERGPDTAGDTRGVTCDPHGWGPLSGCSGESEQDEDYAPSTDTATAEDRAGTAEHEAWHIAVADCYGWSVDSARVYPNGDGDTTALVPLTAPLDQKLAFFVAGSVADGTDAYSLDDLRQAGQAMHDAGVPASDRDHLVDDARDEARRCAATQATQIDRDAADLLEDGELG